MLSKTHCLICSEEIHPVERFRHAFMKHGLTTEEVVENCVFGTDIGQLKIPSSWVGCPICEGGITQDDDVISFTMSDSGILKFIVRCPECLGIYFYLDRGMSEVYDMNLSEDGENISEYFINLEKSESNKNEETCRHCDKLSYNNKEVCYYCSWYLPQKVKIDPIALDKKGECEGYGERTADMPKLPPAN